MADIFTDGPVFEEDQGTVSEPVIPAPAVQPAATPVPVPDQQDTVADQTDTSGSSPDTAGQEPGQGVEEVPNAGTVDYTALLEQLIQQNEKQQELMETLVKENKKLEQDIKNIQNAMPAMMCMLVTYTCFLYPTLGEHDGRRIINNSGSRDRRHC